MGEFHRGAIKRVDLIKLYMWTALLVSKTPQAYSCPMYIVTRKYQRKEKTNRVD